MSVTTDPPQASPPVTSPWKLNFGGWTRVVSRVKREIKVDNLSLVAGGVAFFGFLAIFPALVALISVYGLLTDPAQVHEQMQGVFQMMPAQGAELVREQMVRVAAKRGSTLGGGALLGIVVAVWSANKGMKGLVGALNIAYDTPESRGFVRLTALTLSLTAGAVAFVSVAISLVAGVPAMLAFIRLGGMTDTLVAVLRWPVLALMMGGAIAALYRFAPDRPPPGWTWVTPGSLFATLAFLAGSAVFSLYVSRFGSYADTYGPVAAVAVLMLWLYVVAFVVLIGAELNDESELEAGTKPIPGAQTPAVGPSTAPRHESAPPATA